MKNKIILDGKEYELSDDLAMRIQVEVDMQELERLIEKDPFARMRSDDYYFITAEGCVFAGCETRTIADDERYEAANYCRDKELMEQRALHETLNRLLWRYSETHGGDSNPWPRGTHWFIYGDTANGLEMKVSANDSHKKQGTIYFKEGVIAKAAIEEVVKPFMAAHPEFVW